MLSENGGIMRKTGKKNLKIFFLFFDSVEKRYEYI